MLPLSLKLAWRETAHSWSRFVFLFLCIALGVGAIVAVDLFATHVEQSILGDARGLLGGDIELSWRRTMSQNGQDVLDSLSERKIIISHITELAAMAAVASEQSHVQTTKATSQLVELKALDSFYPLYGSLIVKPAQAPEQLLAPIQSACQRLPCYGAIAQKSLLIRLDVSLGSELRIGQTNFIITGILVKVPDKLDTALSMGPRVTAPPGSLRTTDLANTRRRHRACGQCVHQRRRRLDSHRTHEPRSDNSHGESRRPEHREGVSGIDHFRRPVDNQHSCVRHDHRTTWRRNGRRFRRGACPARHHKAHLCARSGFARPWHRLKAGAKDPGFCAPDALRRAFLRYAREKTGSSQWKSKRPTRPRQE